MNKASSSTEPGPGRLAALCLVAASVLIALLLCEVVLRLRPELLPGEVQLRRLFQLQDRVESIGDPYLGFVYPPNHRTEIESLDFRFVAESDDHGFRNTSPWPAQADIVVVGDSLVYGWGVNRDQSWVSLVARQMPGTRIVNLGLSGTSPQQYFRYFERFGLELEPKLLVFGLFVGNDLVGAGNFDNWLAAGSPGNFGEWQSAGRRTPSPTRMIFDRSLVLQTVASVYRGIGQSQRSMTIATPDGSELELVPGSFTSTIALNDPAGSAFQSVIRSTVMARDLARANGIETLVVMFPTKERVYLPLHGIDFPALNALVARALEAEGIEVINLTEGFRERAATGEALYFRIDGHPNVAGNRLIADILGSRLQSKLVALSAPAAAAH